MNAMSSAAECCSVEDQQLDGDAFRLEQRRRPELLDNGKEVAPNEGVLHCPRDPPAVRHGDAGERHVEFEVRRLAHRAGGVPVGLQSRDDAGRDLEQLSRALRGSMRRS